MNELVKIELTEGKEEGESMTSHGEQELPFVS